MIKKYKYYFVLFLGLAIGAIVLQILLNSFYESEQQQQKDRLTKTQSDAVLRVETGVSIYSTVISSLRAYIENSEEFPTELQLQQFLHDLVRDINFKDSIVVSWVDTNQIFKYVVTPNQIDPAHLKGINVTSFRPEHEIKKLNALMRQDTIILFAPINLKEGWAGFPFNFAARNKKGEKLGYIAPVLNVKYLLDYTYKGGHDSLFVHRFSFGEGIEFDRETVYDGTIVHNKKRDPQYYKNFNLKEDDYIYTDLNLYGLKLRIGSAYKHPVKSKSYLGFFTYLWFGLLCVFSFITLTQYLKNNRLNALLKSANKVVAHKNKQLESNLQKIQILIKEIHHRVKNNMQIISSLLNMQRNDPKNESAAAAFDESKRRIQSMALVHQKLYETEDLSHIKAKDYIEQLVDSVESTLTESTMAHEKKIDVPAELIFNVDTMIPLGLILNELITNTFKYAFQPEKENTMEISLVQKEALFELIYSDNGPGIPDSIDFRNSGTLGLELIHVLTDQLEGTIEYQKTGMSSFIIRFKKVSK
ncbi:MAG: hypothetical protein K0S53_3346 [Bacteroidetes bacterium]|nr:hypothetical protein [Bacteroidota bacterium]